MKNIDLIASLQKETKVEPEPKVIISKYIIINIFIERKRRVALVGH